ncbi:MAG: replication restart helicase PriA [Planctomycetota bacterium]
MAKKYKTYDSGNLFEPCPDEASEQHIVRLAFDTGADSEFDYILPEQFAPVQPGQRAQAPFGRSNKLQIGFCVASSTSTQSQTCPESNRRDRKGVVVSDTNSSRRKFKLKTIKRIVDKAPLLDPDLLALAEWISKYYVCPLGQVLAAMVPAAVKKGAGVKKVKYIHLTNEGTNAQPAKAKKFSPKQQAVINLLRSRGASASNSGIEKKQLLTLAGVATDGPLKKLAQKGIVKITERTHLPHLPAIPEKFTVTSQKVVLNAEQIAALEKINQAIKIPGFSVTLLHGVTDSGKTELYIRAIQTVLAQKRRAIVMLPEIALTTQTIQRFSSRFENIAVMHCRLTPAQRNAQWQKIKSGDADVVIGARSCVFAPLSNLGLIVIDEEHEPSYKQDTVPRYHGRDVAIKRAQLAGAHCILGTATPSLETLANCKTKPHYQLITLKKRVMDLPMPEMRLIDMSTHFGPHGPALISPQLESGLKRVLARGEQAILLLNRRGYSNFIFCPGCKHTLHCQNCDVTLTFHKRPGRNSPPTVTGPHMHSGHAVCHYCLAQTLVPQHCPLCKKRMTMIGLGSQKLTEELEKKFPNANISRVDSDSMDKADAGGYWRLLHDFAAGKIDILAGTQMLAKGLHFPNVTLVGIISADTALALPDFRSNERTFQLISQVAGRTGRGTKKGIVLVQTFLPDQPAIQFALRHDYAGFVRAELVHRQKCNLPPYWRMAIVQMRDTRFDKLQAAADAMRWRIDAVINADNLNIKVRGPMPATISRIHRYHRMQIILQAPDAGPLQKLFTALRSAPALRPAVLTAIDTDPVNLL